MCSQRSSSGKWKPALDPAQMVSQTLMMAASRKPVVMAPLTELSGCINGLLYFSLVSVLQNAMSDRIDGPLHNRGLTIIFEICPAMPALCTGSRFLNAIDKRVDDGVQPFGAP